jgi:hypothetical protein
VNQFGRQSMPPDFVTLVHRDDIDPRKPASRPG